MWKVSSRSSIASSFYSTQTSRLSTRVMCFGVHSLASHRRRRTHTSHHICCTTNYTSACTVTASGRVDTCAHPARVSKRCGQENVPVTAFCSTQFISLHLQLTIYAFLRIAAHGSNISAESEDVPTGVHYLFRVSAHVASYSRHILPGIHQWCQRECAGRMIKKFIRVLL